MKTLSADRPSTDPKDDLFGHAPFAEGLASSICNYPGSDGLVLALYGPWGSGKSTVLGYVAHYIERHPEKSRPVIVSFNPWWFSGQEHLARAFLGQLQAVLPNKNEKFKKLGGLLGEFSEGVGGLIDLSGMTGGAGGVIGKLIEKMTKKNPKDVPSLKSEISTILKKAGKRILVVIDDIDRLTPEETRQLFTVIKALADFPNVVYLLAFDREVAAQAIEEQTGLPGKHYLEKIIQVPFELPPIDRVALRSSLFKQLGVILGDSPQLFDSSYWANVFYDGIDPLFRVPRDVIRFTNTLLITFPAVKGEVNPVDFIVLESLRVFLPELYGTIRSHPEMFTGHSRDESRYENGDGIKAFHDQWSNELPEELRGSMRALVERVFPKVSGTGYGTDWLAEWRKKLRACHPDLFPTYFRLSIPPGGISRAEMDKLLALTNCQQDFGDALLVAKDEKRPDGISKSRALLERLMDHVKSDIPEAHVQTVIKTLLAIGDRLIDPSEELGFFDLGNKSRVARPVYHLLKRVEKCQRANIVAESIKSGDAVAVQMYLLRGWAEEAGKSTQDGDSALLTSDEVERLNNLWLDRVRKLSDEQAFLNHSELRTILIGWRDLASEEEVRNWCDQKILSDEDLLVFISKFFQITKSNVAGDWAITKQPRLNPKWLEKYIDIESCAKRLDSLKQNNKIPAEAQEPVFQFLVEFEMLQKGLNPDSEDAFGYL